MFRAICPALPGYFEACLDNVPHPGRSASRIPWRHGSFAGPTLTVHPSQEGATLLQGLEATVRRPLHASTLTSHSSGSLSIILKPSFFGNVKPDLSPCPQSFGSSTAMRVVSHYVLISCRRLATGQWCQTSIYPQTDHKINIRTICSLQ